MVGVQMSDDHSVDIGRSETRRGQTRRQALETEAKEVDLAHARIDQKGLVGRPKEICTHGRRQRLRAEAGFRKRGINCRVIARKEPTPERRDAIEQVRDPGAHKRRLSECGAQTRSTAIGMVEVGQGRVSDGGQRRGQAGRFATQKMSAAFCWR